MSYLRHLKSLLSGELERLIALCLPFIFERTLRTGLHRIWLRGDFSALPTTPFILAANHSSWWDAYLVHYIRARLPLPLTTVVKAATLQTFPFFRHVGAVAHSEPRTLLRRLQAGEAAFIFPEGDMQPAGQLGDLKSGLAFLAQRTGVDIYPVAFRVVLRGAQQPEAFVVLGERLPSEGTRATLMAHFETALNELLAELDDQLATLHPEAQPSGFVLSSSPSKRFDERIAVLRRLWQR